MDPGTRIIYATGDSGDPSTLYDPNDTSGFYQGKNGVFKDDQGRSYVVNPTTGQKSYIASYADEQQAHDQSGLISSYEWNPDTGQVERNINWGNILGLAAGAEPLIAGAAAALPSVAGGGGAGAGGSSAAEGGGLAGGAMTPAGAAIAPSVDITGAGAASGAAASGVDLMPTLEQAGITGTGGAGSLTKYADLLRQLGSGVSGATDQAAKNRIAQNDPYVSRAVLEDKERSQALKDLYAADRALNPVSSPFNPRPTQAASGAYGQALQAVQGQDLARLQKPAQYTANTLPSLAPGTLEKVGNWLGPILTTAGSVEKTVPILESIGKWLF